jgi:hypothetical protein
MINETDKAVAEYLREIGVEITPSYIGERLNGDWDHDLFSVNLNNKHFTEYKTGLGHRLSSANFNNLTFKQRAHIKGLRTLYPNHSRVYYKPNSIDATLYNVRTQVVPLPTQAGILYSLLLDSQASEMSFSEWCDNYGYSDDSITSLNMYQECEKIAKQLRDVFTREQLNKLSALLEDY